MKFLTAFAFSLILTLQLHAQTPFDHPSILRQLSDAPIEDIIPMNRHLSDLHHQISFQGDVHLVTLKGGLKAVFKSFPQGDDADALAEVAAYKASQFLGFPNIPPTVLRNIKGSSGSLQLYIQPSVDLLAPGQYRKALSSANPDDVANIKLFYFVFGQWDTGPQNLIAQYDPSGKATLFPIDNASIRMRQHVRYGELPFVAIAYSDKLRTNDWGQSSFPFDRVQVIYNPTTKNVQKKLGYAFSNKFLDGFSRDASPEYYVLYQNTLWRQFNRGKPNPDLSFTTHYPQQSIKALQSLNLQSLQNIFSHAKNSYFINDGFFNDILARRDQVLQAYFAILKK